MKTENGHFSNQITYKEALLSKNSIENTLNSDSTENKINNYNPEKLQGFSNLNQDKLTITSNHLNVENKINNYNPEEVSGVNKHMDSCIKCNNISCNCKCERWKKQHKKTSKDSKCPKIVSNYITPVSNRFDHLQNNDESFQSEIDNNIIKNKTQDTDLFESMMIELARLDTFPKSIKEYFNKYEQEHPNMITLPNPNAELHYVEAKLGSMENNAPSIKFMLDGGCSHSVISSKYWQQIEEKEKYELAEGETNFVTTSEGSVRGVKRVILPFYVYDNEGRLHKSVYCFYVVDGVLPHQGYLGIDWLHKSRFCEGVFTDHYYLIDQTNQKKYKIPIESISSTDYAASINLLLLSDVYAVPKQTIKTLVYAEDESSFSGNMRIDQLTNTEDDEKSKNARKFDIIP